MTERPESAHPNPEEMQELLDGALDESRTRDLRLHMESCARCRSQFEAWSVLFQDLGDLVAHSPTPHFSGRVMDALPDGAVAGRSWASRLRRWLGPDRVRRDTGTHLTTDGIQSLLDGELSPASSTRAEAHLGSCRACRDRLATWRHLTGDLDQIGRLAPSPAFAERVMAHVRVRKAVAMARPSLKERVHSWAVVHPRRLERLAALAGAGVTPAAILTLMTYSVLSHPLVTAESLASFLWLKARSGVAGVGSTAAEQMGVSQWMGYLLPLFEASTSSLQATAATCFLLATLVFGAAWVLFRNLSTWRLAWSRDAHLPF